MTPPGQGVEAQALPREGSFAGSGRGPTPRGPRSDSGRSDSGRGPSDLTPAARPSARTTTAIPGGNTTSTGGVPTSDRTGSRRPGHGSDHHSGQGTNHSGQGTNHSGQGTNHSGNGTSHPGNGSTKDSGNGATGNSKPAGHGGTAPPGAKPAASPPSAGSGGGKPESPATPLASTAGALRPERIPVFRLNPLSAAPVVAGPGPSKTPSAAPSWTGIALNPFHLPFGLQRGWTDETIKATAKLKVPLALLAAMAVFVCVQALIDRRDPKVSQAPERQGEDSVGFE